MNLRYIVVGFVAGSSCGMVMALLSLVIAAELGLTYVLGCGCSGALAGALQPRMTSVQAALLFAPVILLPTTLAIVHASVGAPPSKWGAEDWGSLATFNTVFSVVYGTQVWPRFHGVTR